MRLIASLLLAIVPFATSPAQENAAQENAAQENAAQEVAPGENPFSPAEGVSDGSDWKPTHPDGDTPIERMMALAHTDGLPVFDRVELYAVSFPGRKRGERPKTEPGESTFPVRPSKLHADIHAHVTLRGGDCETLGDQWRSLSFDSLGGAFCHDPVYGLRFYRKDLALFETTVCWECQNFYLPTFDAEKRRFTHSWYGFANDEHAKKLLAFLKQKLPHPKLLNRKEASSSR